MQRLAHQGEQDAWFTGNPSYSLFMPKDTPDETYLQSTIEVPFDNPVLYGGTAIATLPRWGDRITDISIKMVLPQLDVPLNPTSWVYPIQTANFPVFNLFFSDLSYQQLQVKGVVPYYSTADLSWLPTSSNNYVTFGVTSSNFTFTYNDPTIVSIGFQRQEDAAFFGFDYTAALSVYPINNVFLYIFPVTQTAPLTFVQSGWIPGYIPYPLPVPYVDSVGTFIIRTAELRIGGQTIDTVTGEFIELQRDLEVPYENQAALTLLIGKNDTSSIRADRTYYSKLPFITQGCPLPIRDLYRQDVQIAVSFDTFYNIAPYTSQQKGFGFTSSDSLVYYNYVTGDNSSGIPGTTFTETLPDGTLLSLGLIIDSVIWDGRYVYMFTRVTILAIDQVVPYFLVYDSYQNIVTAKSATSIRQFGDYVLNQSVTSIGKTLYAVGETGTVYSTSMNGFTPLTPDPTSLIRVPLVANPLFTVPTLIDTPAQTGVSTLTVVFQYTFGISPGLAVYFSQSVVGVVVNVTDPAVTFAFPTGPQDTPFIAAGTRLGFYFPVSTFTIGTDGLHLYITSTVNDAYAGPQYNNVFVYDTASGASSNIAPVAPSSTVNFSTQPVFDGTNMWYIDKYQTTNVYWYNTVTQTWSTYDYSANLGIPQLNIACSVFDGTSVYWFTDVTLTTSLIVGGPVYATTGNWLQYNTQTSTWTAFNWYTNIWTPAMGIPSGDPAIAHAVFDGRYVSLTSYLYPVVFQYDTALPFASPGSYSWFNYSTGSSSFTISKSFLLPNPYGYGSSLARMVFDGRFIFYFPFTTSPIVPSSNASVPAFILRYDTSPIINPVSFQGSLLVKYDKLPSGTPLSNEYYVTQTSMSQTQVDTSILKTYASGPVKEMFIVNQNPTTTVDPYAYTPQESTLRLAFNNESVGDYTTWVLEPFMYHTTMPQRNVSLLSFSFDPESPIPQGTVNFSRIREIQMTYPTQPGTYTRVYTRSFNILRIQNGLGGLAFNSPQWLDMSSIDGRWNINFVGQIFIG